MNETKHSVFPVYFKFHSLNGTRVVSIDGLGIFPFEDLDLLIKKLSVVCYDGFGIHYDDFDSEPDNDARVLHWKAFGEF